jgi:nicotinamidase-related amidase
MQRHPFIADPARSLLLMVDFQAGMRKIISDWPRLLDRTRLLMAAAHRCQLPIRATEQNPDRLGHTDAGLLDSIERDQIFTKMHFSACREDGFSQWLGKSGKDTVVLAGVEAHVCVLQTGLDMLAQGYKVHLVLDAIGSRTETDKTVAIEQFKAAGAVLTSAETLVFGWLGRAGTQGFRALLPAIKSAPPDRSAHAVTPDDE